MECPETEFILLSLGSNDRGSEGTPMGYCAFVGSWNKSWGYRDTMIANFVLYIQICRQTHFPRLRQQNGVYVPDRMQRGQHPAFPGPFRWPPDGRETGAKEVKPDSWVSPLWGGFCGRLTARETRPKNGPQNRVRMWTRSCVHRPPSACCLHDFFTGSCASKPFFPEVLAQWMLPHVATCGMDSLAISTFEKASDLHPCSVSMMFATFALSRGVFGNKDTVRCRQRWKEG